ncbi:hypothetical protein [Pseudomonas anguilliseptica]|nr:hypothetical protein [Pseudomonas anguilliseptica]
MTQLVKRQLIKTLLLTSALVGSSACSSLNLAVPGFEHFTLVGELPADFSSKITATYNPTQREGCTRTFYSYGLGKEVTELNQHFAIFETERNPQPQQIKQQIPLSYKLVGCTLQLASVDFKVVGHYGPDPVFDKFPSGGGLKIYDKRPEQAPRFPANGTLEVRGLCTWFFQISDALARKGGIAKLLYCYGADEQWQVTDDRFKRQGVGTALDRDELSGKTVNMRFRLSPEEQPAMHSYWLKTPAGWKPCLNNWGRITEEACTPPPSLKPSKGMGRPARSTRTAPSDRDKHHECKQYFAMPVSG